MYPLYETDLSVRTKIEELQALPEFPTAARISEFVAQLEELMGRMTPPPKRESSIASPLTRFAENMPQQMSGRTTLSLAPSTRTAMPFGYCAPAQ